MSAACGRGPKCVEAAEQAQDHARGIVRSALVGIANLLRQPAFRDLLQGEQEPFIAEVLKAPDAEKLADLLADLLAERIPPDRQTPNCWRSFSSALWSRWCAAGFPSLEEDVGEEGHRDGGRGIPQVP